MAVVRVVFVYAFVACSRNQPDGPVPAETVAPPPALPAPHEPTALEKVMARHEGEEEPPPDPVLPPGTTAQALAGIAQIQALIRRRQTARIETDDACEACQTNDTERWKAAENLLGTAHLKERTRYANAAPNLGLTIDGVVWSCLGCSTAEEGDEPVPHECPMALTALGDLASEVRAGK
jgi:hypothetical protein